MLLLLLVAFIMSANAQIAILGDSWAEFVRDFGTFDNACANRDIVNVGVGGETASGMIADNYQVEAIPASTQTAWLSIGGNDILNSGCQVSVQDLTSRIQAVIDRLLAKNSQIKVIVTGYSPPSKALPGLCTNALFQNYVDEVYQELATTNSEVEYIDIFELFGGDVNTPSSQTWYIDEIHLNGAGYVRLVDETQFDELLCPPNGFDLSGDPSESAKLETAILLPICIICATFL